MDGALLSALRRIFVTSVHAFYAKRARVRGVAGAKTGSLTAVQRTSSHLRLNPHLHTVFLDGTYHQDGAALAWQELGHLRTREVGEVSSKRCGAWRATSSGVGLSKRTMAPSAPTPPPGGQLEASAVSGQVPPAGPQWLRGLRSLEPSGPPTTSRFAPRSMDPVILSANIQVVTVDERSAHPALSVR